MASEKKSISFNLKKEETYFCVAEKSKHINHFYNYCSVGSMNYI